MCDLVSALMVTSTVVGAAGTMYTAKANSNAAEFNAQVQERNALRSEEQARDAIRRGEIAEEAKRREGAQVIGAQEAAYSAGNVDLGYGSPLDAVLASATNVELDALTIRESARREAEDFRFQAYNQRTGASMDRATAKNSKTSGLFGATGQVLSGASGAFKYRASIS